MTIKSNTKSTKLKQNVKSVTAHNTCNSSESPVNVRQKIVRRGRRWSQYKIYFWNTNIQQENRTTGNLV